MKHPSAPVVVLLTLSAAACAGVSAPPAVETEAVRVAVAPATVGAMPEPVEAGGVVRARNVAQIVSRIMANVESVLVSPGDRVRAGQALVRLDDRDLQANRARAEASRAAAVQSAALADADVQAAQAALDLARATFQRIRDLQAAASATPQEFDEATARLKAAESGLTVAQARVAESRAGVQSAAAAVSATAVAASFATLTAPFDGLVTEKLVDPGTMATPGLPLVTVEDTTAFRLEARLDESRAALVSVGDRVAVQFAAQPGPAAGDAVNPPAVLEGRVGEVSRMLDPGSHDFLVKVDLPREERLRSGMYAKAVFGGEDHEALSVPESALVRRGQLAFVYIVEDGTSRLRLVNAGVPVGGRVEIRSGLREGDRVVVGPPADLGDGHRVTVDGGIRR